MNKILLTLLISFFGFVLAQAAPDKAAALDAIAKIETFERDPEGIIKAVQGVMKFAEESPDVLVLVTPDTLPWLQEQWELSKGEADAVRSLLIGSYVAGSVKHQLKQAKVDGDPYPGWLLALRTYALIKPKWNFVSPAAERLLKMEGEGKLEDYAKKLLKEADETKSSSDNKPI